MRSVAWGQGYIDKWYYSGETNAPTNPTAWTEFFPSPSGGDERPYACINPTTSGSATTYWVSMRVYALSGSATQTYGPAISGFQSEARGNLILVGTPTVVVYTDPNNTNPATNSFNYILQKMQVAYQTADFGGVSSIFQMGKLIFNFSTPNANANQICDARSVDFRMNMPDNFVSYYQAEACLTRRGGVPLVASLVYPQLLGRVSPPAPGGLDWHTWVIDPSTTAATSTPTSNFNWQVFQPNTYGLPGTVPDSNAIALDFSGVQLPVRVGVVPGLCQARTSTTNDGAATIAGRQRMHVDAPSASFVINTVPQLATPTTSGGITTYSGPCVANLMDKDGVQYNRFTFVESSAATATSQNFCIPPFFITPNPSGSGYITPSDRKVKIAIKQKSETNDYTYTVIAPSNGSTPLVTIVGIALDGNNRTPANSSYFIVVECDRAAANFQILASRYNSCGENTFTMYFSRTAALSVVGNNSAAGDVCNPIPIPSTAYFYQLRATPIGDLENADQFVKVNGCNPSSGGYIRARPDGLSWQRIEAAYFVNGGTSLGTITGESLEFDLILPQNCNWVVRRPFTSGPRRNNTWEVLFPAGNTGNSFIKIRPKNNPCNSAQQNGSTIIFPDPTLATGNATGSGQWHFSADSRLCSGCTTSIPENPYHVSNARNDVDIANLAQNDVGPALELGSNLIYTWYNSSQIGSFPLAGNITSSTNKSYLTTNYSGSAFYDNIFLNSNNITPWDYTAQQPNRFTTSSPLNLTATVEGGSNATVCFFWAKQAQVSGTPGTYQKRKQGKLSSHNNYHGLPRLTFSPNPTGGQTQVSRMYDDKTEAMPDKPIHLLIISEGMYVMLEQEGKGSSINVNVSGLVAGSYNVIDQITGANGTLIISK